MLNSTDFIKTVCHIYSCIQLFVTPFRPASITIVYKLSKSPSSLFEIIFSYTKLFQQNSMAFHCNVEYITLILSRLIFDIDAKFWEEPETIQTLELNCNYWLILYIWKHIVCSGKFINYDAYRIKMKFAFRVSGYTIGAVWLGLVFHFFVLVLQEMFYSCINTVDWAPCHFSEKGITSQLFKKNYWQTLRGLLNIPIY